MGLYSREISTYLNSRDWPKNLQWLVKERAEPEPHLTIFFFRDNWLTLTPHEQLKIHSIVSEIMDKLWRDGIPTYVSKKESKSSV